MAILTVAPTADAHTLNSSRAADKAWLALYDWADYRERYYETVTDVDLSRRDCTRFSRHRFECVGSVEYSTDPDYEYDDGTDVQYAVANVRVRYAGPFSARLVTRVYRVEWI